MYFKPKWKKCTKIIDTKIKYWWNGNWKIGLQHEFRLFNIENWYWNFKKIHGIICAIFCSAQKKIELNWRRECAKFKLKWWHSHYSDGNARARLFIWRRIHFASQSITVCFFSVVCLCMWICELTRQESDFNQKWFSVSLQALCQRMEMCALSVVAFACAASEMDCHLTEMHFMKMCSDFMSLSSATCIIRWERENDRMANNANHFRLDAPIKNIFGSYKFPKAAMLSLHFLVYKCHLFGGGTQVVAKRASTESEWQQPWSVRIKLLW